MRSWALPASCDGLSSGPGSLASLLLKSLWARLLSPAWRRVTACLAALGELPVLRVLSEPGTLSAQHTCFPGLMAMPWA